MIGTPKNKAKFDIFDFYLSQNFNFPCILGGKGTRSLCCNGQQIVGDYFTHQVNDEVNSGLKLIPKLTMLECVKKWKSFLQSYTNLTLFRMGFFEAAHRWGRRGEKRSPSL